MCKFLEDRRINHGNCDEYASCVEDPTLSVWIADFWKPSDAKRKSIVLRNLHLGMQGAAWLHKYVACYVTYVT